MQDRHALYLSVWFLRGQTFSFAQFCNLKKSWRFDNDWSSPAKSSLKRRHWLTSKLVELAFSKWELTIIIIYITGDSEKRLTSLPKQKSSINLRKYKVCYKGWNIVHRENGGPSFSNWRIQGKDFIISEVDLACFKSHIKITKRFDIVLIWNSAYLGRKTKYNTISSQKRLSKLVS